MWEQLALSTEMRPYYVLWRVRRNFFLSLPLCAYTFIFMNVCVSCVYISVCPCVQVYLSHIPHQRFYNDWVTYKNFNYCGGIRMAQVQSQITSDHRLPRVPLIVTHFLPRIPLIGTHFSPVFLNYHPLPIKWNFCVVLTDH